MAIYFFFFLQGLVIIKFMEPSSREISLKMNLNPEYPSLLRESIPNICYYWINKLNVEFGIETLSIYICITK